MQTVHGGLKHTIYQNQYKHTKFLIAVKACKNDVFFDSNEGDILNLASTLSQYVFCSIAGKESILENGSVRCVNEEDYSLLADFLCED